MPTCRLCRSQRAATVPMRKASACKSAARRMPLPASISVPSGSDASSASSAGRKTRIRRLRQGRQYVSASSKRRAEVEDGVPDPKRKTAKPLASERGDIGSWRRGAETPPPSDDLRDDEPALAAPLRLFRRAFGQQGGKKVPHGQQRRAGDGGDARHGGASGARRAGQQDGEAAPAHHQHAEGEEQLPEAEVAGSRHGKEADHARRRAHRPGEQPAHPFAAT